MLADAFDEEVKTFYRSADPAPVFQFQIDLSGSHWRFRDRKYDQCGIRNQLDVT